MRLVLALSLFVGCSDDPGGGGPAVDSHVNFFELPGSTPPQLDMLIVVDDTTAMAPYQDQLDALPATIDMALVGATSSEPDLRIAVTTTAGAGTLRSTGIAEPFLASSFDAKLRPSTNYTGTLAAAITPLLAVGATSTAPTQPLQAAKAALDANPTFLRDSSFLALVVLTVNDDASSDTPANYANGFKATRTDPLNFVFGAAYEMPAARLDAFAAQLPNRTSVEDITTTELSEAFYVITQLSRTVLGVPCVRIPLDVDPNTAGEQYECDVNLHYVDDTTEVVRQCQAGMTEVCYEFAASPVICSESGVGEFRLRNTPSRYWPLVRGQCVVEGSE